MAFFQLIRMFPRVFSTRCFGPTVSCRVFFSRLRNCHLFMAPDFATTEAGGRIRKRCSANKHPKSRHPGERENPVEGGFRVLFLASKKFMDLGLLVDIVIVPFFAVGNFPWLNFLMQLVGWSLIHSQWRLLVSTIEVCWHPLKSEICVVLLLTWPMAKL